MDIERPDLSQLPADVRDYIEALEAELQRLRPRARATSPAPHVEESFDPSEPPGSRQVITLTAAGSAKRTPRHLYQRQRRGGMGVLDLEGAEEDPAVALLVADESDTLLLITNFARAYRLPVSKLPETPQHSPATPLVKHLLLDRGERVVIALPSPTRGFVALVNRRGEVRRVRYHTFRETMPQGTLLYSTSEFGPPAAACLTPGEGELFIATRQGKGIRFAEEAIPVRGAPGIRLGEGDEVAALCAVRPESGVFLIGADGRGTIRQMAGFAANKAPGAGGKIAINSDDVAGAVTVHERDDLFLLSRHGKMIRFAADEVPAKEGVVQGVYCMSLRGDEVVAVAEAKR